jgi:hypothetical protein
MNDIMNRAKNCWQITNKLAACYNDKIAQRYKIMSYMEIAVSQKEGMQTLLVSGKEKKIYLEMYVF